MPDPISLTDSINAALDRAYNATAGRMLLQIRAITNAPNSSLQRALKELDAEADRLDEADEKMRPDNPVLEKALNEYETTFTATQTLISANDNDIQATGQKVGITAITAKVFLNLTRQLIQSGVDPLSPQAETFYTSRLSSAGINWATPTVLDFATNYVDSPAWASRLDGWGKGYADMTRGTLLQGVQSGWGPKYTASQLRQVAQSLPSSAAETLTRTLQVTSYRDASAAMEVVNSRYITRKIRTAHLDDRTCLSCIGLHGTELELGERVDDHYRGRCSEFYVIPGGPQTPEVMQADSQPGKRNFVPYQTGPEWFNSLPESRQKQQASFVKSPAKFRAFKDGVPLSEFVGEHTDDVFGRQAVERSLKAILGDDAGRYYQANQ